MKSRGIKYITVFPGRGKWFPSEAPGDTGANDSGHLSGDNGKEGESVSERRYVPFGGAA